MEIYADGTEYAHFGCFGVPPDLDPPELEINGEWLLTEWWVSSGVVWNGVLRDQNVTPAQVDSGAARIARVLLTLPAGTYKTRLRFTDTQETIIRDGQNITVRPAP